AQNLSDKDKADGTEHVDKRVKESPRPYMTRKILYNQRLWIEWALQPFDLPDLIARRNKTGKRTFIHVASIYEKNGVSGFGYIIRDCHGTPLVAYSEYFDTKDIEPVSEFYLEMMAVDKSLEHAEELGIKIVSMVSTSREVAIAVHDCYMGELCGMRINDKEEAKVTNLSGDIIDKLERRRDHDTNVFYFRIHQQTRERSLNSAVCLVEVGLEASGTVSKFELSFDKVQQMMPLAKDKLVKLLKLLHKEASSRSLFHP
ncbi:hypothetical protein MKX03_033048, partial [Papaver bracteatum]